MKIIRKDNFDRETVSEKIIAENVMGYYAVKISNFLNDTLSGDDSPAYFFVEEDNYKPYKWEP